MKCDELRLKNFTAFEDATFEFCPGINLLLGANSTGKSHVLRALYAIQKWWEETVRDDSSQKTQNQQSLTLISKFQAAFKTSNGSLLALNRRGSGDSGFSIATQCGSSFFELSYPENFQSRLSAKFAPCLFIPSRETLSLFEGFISAYANRELSFDVTHYDLCVALSAGLLKGKKAQWAHEIVGQLAALLEGPVTLRDGRFYVGDFETHLVAEGHRKVAMLVQLLRNGGITADSTLFWDEPESGLNPRLVKTIADVLLRLAESGLQIFLATHDYLLTQELSLAAEYQTSKAEIRFFCLSREAQDAPVSVQAASTLAEIDDNPILKEFAAHYDREQALFGGEVEHVGGD